MSVKSIKAALAAAGTAALVELVRGEPLGPQLRVKLDQANARRTALRAEVDALALDVELGDRAATERQRELQAALSKATAECDRLEAAYETALDRDQQVENEAAEKELQAYERILDARLTAAQNFDEASSRARTAARQLLAATDLLRTELPRSCTLASGLTIGGQDFEVLASTEKVRVENDHLRAAIRGQVQAMTAIKRREKVSAREEVSA
jgi:hypothetical protein